MKKKLIALVCALALAVGLVGCSLSTPDSVGTIGEVDISSGLYLLAQFDAYQTAAESCNAAIPDGASAQTSAFSAAVAAALPDIYAVLDGEPSSDASSLSTALLGSDNIDATFSEEGTADAVRALKPGEAAAVRYSSYALMMLVRLDPLDADTLDSLRAQALSDMKSGELQDSIQSYGAQLPHALDSAAMKKMPASKIKNEK